MLSVTLSIRLTLVGLVLSRATAAGAPGVDAPMARGSDGKYYIPYSLVRGRLRQSWEELREATDKGYSPPVDRLLGSRSGDARQVGDSGFEPMRGLLRFTDFRGESEVSGPDYIHRLRMDSSRGAAHKGALQVIESPFPPGQEVTFAGTISYVAVDGPDADAIKSYIDAGLRWTTSLGGQRSIGFGRLTAVSIAEVRHPVQVSVPAAVGKESEVLDIAIRPRGPFCVAKRQVDRNLFESDIVLSGGVLRGTLATTLKQLLSLPGAEIDGTIPPPWRELGQNFNRIRFSHAFPAVAGAAVRPVFPPLSLVQDLTTKEVYDVAGYSGPLLLGKPCHAYAPTFSVDWKDSDGTSRRVDREFGWAAPVRELRVRTAMSRATRRAKDEDLFAYEMVVPAGCHWLARIDLSQVPAGATRQAVEMQLRSILSHGLHSIGKTKVDADVGVEAQIAPAYPSNASPIDGLWVVTLQTSALLCDPKELNELSDEGELFAAYEAAWHGLSGGALKLVRYFASQSLAGGYLVRRFQPSKPYNPFLLTDPGSVFVLEAPAAASAAQSRIREWLHHGLPLPGWARQRYGDDWRTCPFLPADGFGEIAANLACHVTKRPTQEMVHAI